jgi:hypothetical protein
VVSLEAVSDELAHFHSEELIENARGGVELLVNSTMNGNREASIGRIFAGRIYVVHDDKAMDLDLKAMVIFCTRRNDNESPVDVNDSAVEILVGRIHPQLARQPFPLGYGCYAEVGIVESEIRLRLSGRGGPSVSCVVSEPTGVDNLEKSFDEGRHSARLVKRLEYRGKNRNGGCGESVMNDAVYYLLFDKHK